MVAHADHRLDGYHQWDGERELEEVVLSTFLDRLMEDGGVRRCIME